jgi:hypothetical protein
MKDIKIINEICNTYDLSELHKTSLYTQNLFFEYSKLVLYQSGNNKGNQVLATMINNYYTYYYFLSKQIALNLHNQVNYISGPNTLIYLESNEYNKKIYLFGEYHYQVTSCKNVKNLKYNTISDYLYHLFSQSDKFIDFYLEHITFPPNYNIDNLIDPKATTIKKLYSLVKNCINPNIRKSKCNWKNIRTHFIDTRYYNNKNTNEIGILMTNIKIINNNNLNINQLPENSYKLLLNFINNHNNIDKLIKIILDNILNINLNVKEINKSTLDLNLINIIIHKMIKYRVKYVFKNTQLNESLYFLYNQLIITKNKTEKYHKILLKIYNIFKSIESVVQDIYTVTRIFKKFNTKNNDYFHPIEPKNIIIYVGKAHAELLNYIFIKYLHFKSFPIIRDNNFPNCLNISNIKQPFFS